MNSALPSLHSQAAYILEWNYNPSWNAHGCGPTLRTLGFWGVSGCGLIPPFPLCGKARRCDGADEATICSYVNAAPCVPHTLISLTEAQKPLQQLPLAMEGTVRPFSILILQ
jgi:hypothetical protein